VFPSWRSLCRGQKRLVVVGLAVNWSDLETRWGQTNEFYQERDIGVFNCSAEQWYWHTMDKLYAKLTSSTDASYSREFPSHHATPAGSIWENFEWHLMRDQLFTQTKIRKWMVSLMRPGEHWSNHTNGFLRTMKISTQRMALDTEMTIAWNRSVGITTSSTSEISTSIEMRSLIYPSSRNLENA
jgi:hypothetical protein